MQNLPDSRQTLLFAATQTKDIKALVRLSLKSPDYLFVSSKIINNDGQSNNAVEKLFHGVAFPKAEHDEDGPKKKDASAIKLVGVPKGLAVIWSFIKTHLKAKMIIFLSSGKQVRFVVRM